MGAIRTFQDLEVYRLAHTLAMEIFQVTKKFPKEETYSLIDQIRRSSRSVAVNIAEGWGKLQHENLFKRHLIDSMGSVEETKSWLLFSVDCEYLSRERYNKLLERYEELGAKLFKLHEQWRSFR
jgi:four helix bundle protein